MGRQLVQLVQKLRVGTLDPMSLKRLQQTGIAFIKIADETDTVVAQLTVAPPEDDEEGDEGEEGDEDEDDEGEEEEVTEAASAEPVPAPAPTPEDTKPAQEQP